MNKTIRKFAVCSVLTAVVATGWGKPLATPVAKPAEQPVAKPVATPAPKPVATTAPKPAAPVVSSAPKAVAPPVSIHTLTATQKALEALDGGAFCDTESGLKYQDGGKRLVSCDPKAVAVTIKAEVELIYGNAFRGCTELLRVHFLGDAPNAADEVFADLPRGCTICIEKGRKGWPNGSPSEWKGVAVRFYDEVKSVSMEFDGKVKIDGIGYKVNACGDGVALSADLAAESDPSVTALGVPERIGNAPVRILGDSVFPACSNLTSVAIPASVTNFSLGAFLRSGRPQQIEVAASNPEYRMVNGVVYGVGSKTVIMARKDVSSVKVPSDAQAIGPEAFKGCGSLTSIEFPATLKAIGKGAFAGCVGLSVVTIPADADVAPDAFEGCCATIRKVGTYLHHDGFAGKSSETRWIPEDMKAEGPFSDPLPLREAVERAGKGDGFVLYSLAIHCAKGVDAKRNPVRAMKYLREAVSEKDANAEFLLGLVLESRMIGSDLNDSAASGIAGRLGMSDGTSTSPKAITPFEKYIGAPSAAFEKAAETSAGSLANEKDYELLRGVYESSCQHGCAAARTRLEHLSYLSMLECSRVEKVANQRLLDELSQSTNSEKKEN